MARARGRTPVFRFGSFELDVSTGRLLKRGVRVSLREKSFRILTLLLESAGDIVTREELRQYLWPDDVFVDFDNNLNTAIGALRQALCDSADHPRFIETVPKHGYRFIGKLQSNAFSVTEPQLPRVRLLVLPFVNLTGDPAQETLSDALTDEIITAFSSVAPEQLAIIARTTSMHYKGSHMDVGSIGRELDVDYIVEGAVRRNGNNVAINVQLVQTSDQLHLFAKRYDCTNSGISRIQTLIAEEIATRIPPGDGHKFAPSASTRSRSRNSKGPKNDLAALNEYIHGRAFIEKANPTAMRAAKHHLERAVALDPEFADAYDALAEVYWYLGYAGMIRPREAFAAGIVHAVRAIEIDGERAETHALLGQFHKISEYNWAEVHREMELALHLNPNSALVRMRYALSDLMPHGRIDDAIYELDRALEIDPFSVWTRTWLGIMLVLGRQYDRAIEESRRLLTLDPASPQAFFVLAVSFRCQGHFDEALAAIQDAVELSGGAAMMLGWQGLTLATCGQRQEACNILQRLHDMASQQYVPPCSMAWIYLGLDEIDHSFEWLNRAVEECDQLLMPIKTYAFLDPIRTDPRFAKLLQKMNLDSENAHTVSSYCE